MMHDAITMSVSIKELLTVTCSGKYCIKGRASSLR